MSLHWRNIRCVTGILLLCAHPMYLASYCAPGSNLSKLTLACCELQIQRDFSRTPADEIILRSFRAEVRGL